MVNHGRNGRRRFFTGDRVQAEGLYREDWGTELLLLEGERFPAHPEMGNTRWAYAGPPLAETIGLQANGGLPRPFPHH